MGCPATPRWTPWPRERRSATPRAAAASIRRIAAAVGVAPNAVYTYFPDKAAVSGALVERLLGEVDHAVLVEPGRPWPERIEALAVELRTRLLAHPGAVPLLLGGPLDGPHALRIGERMLDALSEAGQGPDAGVAAQEFPRTAAAAVLGTRVGTEQYLWGLRRLLAGFAAAGPAAPDLD